VAALAGDKPVAGVGWGEEEEEGGIGWECTSLVEVRHTL